MGKKSKQKKNRRRKKRQDRVKEAKKFEFDLEGYDPTNPDHIKRGESWTGDVFLDLLGYMKMVDKDREGQSGKPHLYHDLSESAKKAVITMLMNARKAGELPELKDDRNKFAQVFRDIVKVAHKVDWSDTDTENSEEVLSQIVSEVDKRKEAGPFVDNAMPSIDKSPWKPPSHTYDLQDAIFKIPGSTGKGEVLSKRQLVLELYHSTVKHLQAGKAMIRGTTSGSKETHMQATRLIWGMIRDANIFEVPVSLYSVIYRQADIYSCELAGLDWSDPTNGKPPAEGEGERYWETLYEEGATAPFPEKLPFETCWLGFDRPVQLSRSQVNFYHIDSGGYAKRVWLYAYLITRRGVVLSFMVGERENGETAILFTHDRGFHSGLPQVIPFHEQTWTKPSNLNCFVVPWLMEWINDHQVVVEENTLSFSYRREYKKASKVFKMTHIPRPYYTIYMRDELILEEDLDKRRQAKLGYRRQRYLDHRGEVQGSYHIRVSRGPLPLDRKTERKLRKHKNRKVYTVTKPDAELASDLMKRGVRPKRHDEWLSVLKTWHRDHLRGPEGAPVIPAIRKSGRKRITDLRRDCDGHTNQGGHRNLHPAPAADKLGDPGQAEDREGTPQTEDENKKVG